MPNISKETLDLIKTVAGLSERVDAIRVEIQGLQQQFAGREQHLDKRWDRFWTVAAAVLGAVIGSIISSVVTYYLVRPE